MRRLPIALVAAALSAVPGAAKAGVIAQGSLPGQEIEALDLKADGAGMVTLTLRITNNSDKLLELTCALRDQSRNGDCTDVSGITLIDAVNKKRYLVIQDSDRHCICTTTVKNLPAKSAITVWAKFPAPPDAVNTVSAIVPLFLPLEGVPVTRP